MLFMFMLNPAAQAVQSLKLRFSSGVSLVEKSIIDLDLNNLSQARLPVGNGFWEMELSAPVTTERLSLWLQERVQVVIHSAHPLDASVIRKEKQRFFVPRNSTIDLSVFQVPEVASGGALINSQVLMSQVSGPFYLESKRTNTLRSLFVQGLGWMEVFSPRVGIVRIGASFFEPLSMATKDSPKDSDLNAIHRLQTLFHEGRHSDGNGENTTFPHQICPRGHTYQGRRACDDSVNGGYRISAETAKLLSNDCRNCSVAEKEALLVLEADSWERILPAARRKDTRPESVQRLEKRK